MSKILLFIPMYNCEKQIPRVLGQLTDEVCSYLSEVIVVNNRSTDGGEQVAADYLKQRNLPIKAKVLRNDDNYGLGGSHKVAFQYAMDHGFDYVIVLHGDDQGDISNILPYLKNREYEQYDCFRWLARSWCNRNARGLSAAPRNAYSYPAPVCAGGVCQIGTYFTSFAYHYKWCHIRCQSFGEELSESSD